MQASTLRNLGSGRTCEGKCQHVHNELSASLSWVKGRIINRQFHANQAFRCQRGLKRRNELTGTRSTRIGRVHCRHPFRGKYVDVDMQPESVRRGFLEMVYCESGCVR